MLENENAQKYKENLSALLQNTDNSAKKPNKPAAIPI